MKKIINNRVYDTETAKSIGEYEPNPYRSDFSWFCETLYQKKTGEFFLHGDGNANSRYSKSCGQNTWCGDEKIVPMSYEEAREWVEKHLDAEDYIALFGDPEDEEGEKFDLHAMISAASGKKLKQQASQKGLSISAYLDQLIAEN